MKGESGPISPHRIGVRANPRKTSPFSVLKFGIPILLFFLMLFAAVWVGADSSGGFRTARSGRVLTFPRDHGKHPMFMTEWWYFTGNLESEDHREWGFQLTFFRRSLTREPSRKDSAWGVRDLYPAHFALLDVKRARFFQEDIISREGPGLAGAEEGRLSVHVKDWSARMTGNVIRLEARAGKYALELSLKPEKPLVLHGRRGFSQKGSDPKQASYYYSFTRLSVRGRIVFDGKPFRVKGLAWMDHEFGSSMLTGEQAGWDWFSVQLDDGTELMVFYLRRRDGANEEPFGSFVSRDGKKVALRGSAIEVSATGRWKSPRTGAVYPSGWIIQVPSLEISLQVTPMAQDQELSTSKSTGIVYWEGAVSVDGTRKGKKVKGSGYVELTGYAHPMTGRL